jgi:ABC-type uncharacterized transport system substrate-binding protein
MSFIPTDFSQRRRWLLRAARWAVAVGTTGALQVPALAAVRERRDFAIVVSDDGETTRKVLADLRRRFPRAQISDAKAAVARKALVLAIGAGALRAVMAEGGEAPVISVFTSSQVYHSIMEAAGDHRPPSTAIYAEPAPAAQFRLINMLFKRPVRTTVVLGTRTSFLEAFLQRAAASVNVPVAIETYGQNDSINRILSRTSDAPAILAIPDSSVYNSDNLRTVLLTTYRNGQAVIGFSVALVRAGALATTYSDVEDIGAQLEEVVDQYSAGARLPEPQFPRYFRTVINEDVARSLNLVVDDSTRNFTHRPPAVRP